MTKAYKVWQFDWHGLPREERLDAMRGEPLAWGKYRLVAAVRAADLEDVFLRTQSIDAPWYTGTAVETCFAPTRSVCVGDVIEDESGARHIVRGFGFAPYAPPV